MGPDREKSNWDKDHEKAIGPGAADWNPEKIRSCYQQKKRKILKINIVGTKLDTQIDFLSLWLLTP